MYVNSLYVVLYVADKSLWINSDCIVYAYCFYRACSTL